MFVGLTVIEREVIRNFAGHCACATPDALGGVDQDGFAHFFHISDKGPFGHIVRERSPTSRIYKQAMCREIQQLRATNGNKVRDLCNLIAIGGHCGEITQSHSDLLPISGWHRLAGFQG